MAVTVGVGSGGGRLGGQNSHTPHPILKSKVDLGSSRLSMSNRQEDAEGVHVVRQVLYMWGRRFGKKELSFARFQAIYVSITI